MKKVIFNAGTKVNLSNELNTAQDYSYDNAYELLELLIENVGVLCDTYSGAISANDTSLKIVWSPGDPQITIKSGTALTQSGIVLYSLSDGSTGTEYATLNTISGTTSSYYLYATYDPQQSVSTSKIAGFLYNPSGTSVAYTRNDVAATRNFDIEIYNSPLTGTSLDSRVLIGSGYFNSTVWTSGYDARTPIRIKSDLLPYEVFRKYGAFSNIGQIATNKLGIQSDDETTIYYINNSGVTDGEMSISGLVEAYNYKHPAGSETTFDSATLTASGNVILTNYNAIEKGTGYSSSTDTPTASQEFTRLFRQGIINFDGRTDGVNDKRVLTTNIPSKPNTPQNLSGFLLEMSTDSVFSTELNAALLNYNLKDLVKTQKNEGYALANAFYSEMQRVAAEFGYTTMSGFYLYSGAVYLGSRVYTNENYTYTLQAAASGIAEGGYSITLSGLGFTLPSGNGYYTGTSPTFVERITSTLTSLDNGIDTAERDRISAATSVLTKTNRLELAPSFARKNYRCRLSWSAVSEINNEAIKCYQVRIYKLNPLSQGGVSNGLAVKTLENDYGKILEVKNDQTYERVTILSGFVSGTPDAVTQTLIGGYSGTVLWDTNYNTYNVRVGDIVTQGSNNYYVTQVYSNSGLLLDRYAFASPTPVIIYREMLDTYSSDTRYDFDIYADQYYYIYVRAVSQYGISSDWSSGLKLATNSLTNDAGHTLLNIINSDELLLAKTNEVRNVVYTQKLNSLITSLQRQVEDTPTRTTVDNLATRVKQIEIS